MSVEGGDCSTRSNYSFFGGGQGRGGFTDILGALQGKAVDRFLGNVETKMKIPVFAGVVKGSSRRVPFWRGAHS